MDSAIRYAVFTRLWQLFTGPVTQLLIVLHFTVETNDYYAAFLSLLGTQIFVELGLNIVLISIASHEWAGLKYDGGRVDGNQLSRSRLASLCQMSGRWYRVAALLFAIVTTSAGLYFFGDTELQRAAEQHSREDVDWTSPWVTLVLLNSVQLLLLPYTAILEGCHQLDEINRVRFRQALFGSGLVWLIISMNGGLWALPASAAVRLCGELYLVRYRFGKFFSSLKSANNPADFDWADEVLPLQWRIAVQGILFWVATHLPLLMVFRGQETGDTTRLGMTLTILVALQSASLAWVETKRPLFGSLIADHRYEELDRVFFRVAGISVAMMSAGAMLLLAFVTIVNFRDEWICVRFAGRLLPISLVLVYGIAFIANQPGLCANLYVRAHKRDPFLVVTIISNIALATLQIVLGRLSGVAGVAYGYLLGISLVQTPLLLAVWWKTRQEWHSPADAENTGRPSMAEDEPQ